MFVLFVLLAKVSDIFCVWPNTESFFFKVLYILTVGLAGSVPIELSFSSVLGVEILI